jgi:hypothetical protein
MDRRSIAAAIAVLVYAVVRVVYLGGTLLWISVIRDEQTTAWPTSPQRQYLLHTRHSFIKNSHTPLQRVDAFLITTALPCNRFALLRIQKKKQRHPSEGCAKGC